MWRVLAVTLLLIGGVCLAAVSCALVVEVWKSFAARGEVSSGVVLHGIVLVILWGLWSVLPDCLQIVIRRLLKRRRVENRD